MIYLLSILAAFVCALCDGVAAILQKISVDRQPRAKSVNLTFLRNIFQDWPFILGSLLDVFGAVVTIAAVYYLPLFLVEAIVATSIVITALIEHFYLHRKIEPKIYAFIALMFLGIVLLAIAASPQRASQISAETKWLLLLAPLPIFFLGMYLAKIGSYAAGVCVAILGGIEFGTTTIASRIFVFSHPWWHLIYNPYVWSIVAGGVMGISLFSVALQHSHATVINAALTSTKIIVPTLVGILLLGDKARNGLWSLVTIGLLITSLAAVFLTLQPETEELPAHVV